MKNLLLLLALCLLAKASIYAQANPSANGTKNPVTRTIESFGAIANDTIDDSYALFKAARFFSNQDTITGLSTNYIDYDTLYGELNFGAGTYIVGEQEVWNSDTATWYAKAKYDPLFHGGGLDGLIIQGVTDLTGVLQTKIKIKPGVYFGYFEKSDSTTPHSPLLRDSGGIAAQSSTILRIGWSARNVLVKNLELDGSADTYYIGAKQNNVGDGDFNLALAHGIDAGCQLLSIENVYTHNFGLDGIKLSIFEETPRNFNIYLNKVKSQWNGRHGFSWCAGRDMKVENSIFAYNGLKEGTYDSSGVLNFHPTRGSLSANVDVEAEDGHINRGIFKNCKMLGNAKGFSLVVNSYQLSNGTVVFVADSLSFDICDIKGYINNDPYLGWAYGAVGLAGARKRNHTFTNCTIVGSVELPPVQALPGLTTFKNCNITGSNMKRYEMDYATIIGGSGPQSVIFDQCSITSQSRKALFSLIPAGGVNTDPNKYVTVNNCALNFGYDIPDYAISPGNAWFVRFTGNNTWTQVPVTASLGGDLKTGMQGITVNGSSIISPKNTFTMAADKHEFSPATGSWTSSPFIFGETPCEFLDVVIGGSSLYSSFDNLWHPTYIGEGANVIIKAGSFFKLRGDVYLAGKITVEPGGTLYFLNNAQVHVLDNVPAHITGSIALSSYSTIIDTSRSQLMAPQQFLRSDINPAEYDTVTCPECEIIGGVVVCPEDISGFIADVKTGHRYLKDAHINISPNPTNDKIKVRFAGEGKTTIMVIDINGKVLQTLTSENAEEEISLQQYPAGTYLIKVSNSSTSTVKKVTKTD